MSGLLPRYITLRHLWVWHLPRSLHGDRVPISVRELRTSFAPLPSPEFIQLLNRLRFVTSK